MTRARRSGGNKKVANSLVALSSAAVLGVYTAGFVRTRAAAQRFAEADQRRTPVRAQVPAPATPTLTAPAAPAVPQQVASAPAPAVRAELPPQAPATAPASAKSRKATSTSGESLSVPPAATRTLDAKAEPSSTTAAVAAPTAAAIPDAALAPAPAAAATTAPPAPAAAAPPAAPVAYKDGSYTGWGTSRHGDIQATVVIENGRIASASISQCYTRYPCSWIVALPPQVAQRQSPEVDFVSGATQSTNAFYYAVVEALSKAK